MRPKSSMQNNNYNRPHRKPRYSQGGGSGHSSGHHQHNRPRKNYGASREKYLAQARDAMASGDRVMAEYFYQHADHCYRMMVEEGARPQQRPAQPGDEQQVQEAQPQEEAPPPAANSSLPAFLTGSYEQQQGQKPVDPATVQNWEDRDA